MHYKTKVHQTVFVTGGTGDWRACILERLMMPLISNRVGSSVYSNSKCIKLWRVDGAYAASFGSSSSGVPNPRTFRGRSLSSVSILWRSAWVISEKSVPFG